MTEKRYVMNVGSGGEVRGYMGGMHMKYRARVQFRVQQYDEVRQGTRYAAGVRTEGVSERGSVEAWGVRALRRR